MPERSLLKARGGKWPLKSGTCGEMPPAGPREGRGDGIQSACLCELAGADRGDVLVLVDRRTDGQMGWGRQLRRWAGSARARHRRQDTNGNYETTCVKSNA